MVTKKEHLPINIVSKGIGVGDAPLYNPNKMPAMALATAKTKSSTDSSYPLVLRTYNYPATPVTGSHLALADTTSDISMAEAMAATSAVPGLAHRVEITIDDTAVKLADGLLHANDPIVLALNEARKLYPKRPIGLVMSFGFTDIEQKFADRAIAVARLENPKLIYQRIHPKGVWESINPAETDMKKIAIAEEKTMHVMSNDASMNRMLKKSLGVLFDPSRSVKKWQLDGGNGNRSASIINKEDFDRRTKERISLLESEGLHMNTRSIRLSVLNPGATDVSKLFSSMEEEDNDNLSQTSSQSTHKVSWNDEEDNDNLSQTSSLESFLSPKNLTPSAKKSTRKVSWNDELQVNDSSAKKAINKVSSNDELQVNDSSAKESKHKVSWNDELQVNDSSAKKSINKVSSNDEFQDNDGTFHQNLPSRTKNLKQSDDTDGKFVHKKEDKEVQVRAKANKNKVINRCKANLASILVFVQYLVTWEGFVSCICTVALMLYWHNVNLDKYQIQDWSGGGIDWVILGFGTLTTCL